MDGTFEGRQFIESYEKEKNKLVFILAGVRVKGMDGIGVKGLKAYGVDYDSMADQILSRVEKGKRNIKDFEDFLSGLRISWSMMHENYKSDNADKVYEGLKKAIEEYLQTLVILN